MKDFSPPISLDDLLSATRARWRATPDKIALKEGGEQLTFAMLEARANHMARRLVEKGGEVGDFVGYLGPSGIPYVVTFWACFKAGMTFLPISPKFPPSSVADILRTANVRFFVSELELLQDALEVCRLEFPKAGEVAEDFEVPSVPDEVLSIANSTSGSTGIPKVVGHSRQMLAASAVDEAAFVGLTETSVVGHCGTMWVVCVLAALSAGAQVSCYDALSGSPQDLMDWLAGDGVTYWFIYPALYRTLAEAKGQLPAMEVLLLCGEAVFRHDFELFEKITSPGAVLLNTYGQQEFLWATAYAVRNGERLRYEKLPVGVNVCENDLQIVDENGQPVAAGDIGEIVHHSFQVPKGYIGNPERTAAVFSTGADGLYRFATSDLGYIDGSGNLHIVGRKDDQIKIRSFNVQPVDIEAEIKPHPDVQDVAVTVSYCARGLPRLVCFYEGEVAPDDLKQWLSVRIAAFMVPQFFISVEALPRTATGKLQRNRLVLPETSDTARVLARGADELALTEIWRQVLGHDDFGVTDNFFDAGGDSLRAMELILMISNRFDRLLTLDQMVMAEATIEGLAKLLAAPTERVQLKTLKPGVGGCHLVVGHVYSGGLNDYLEFARAVGDGIRVSGIRADYTGRSRAYSIRKKAQEARRLLPKEEDLVLMGYSFGGRLAFEMAHLSDQPERLILIDPTGPFNEAIRNKVKNHTKSVFMPSQGRGRENTYWGDFWYRPRRLKVRAALLITCDTSFEEDIEGWRNVVDGPVTHFGVQGTHFDILRGANAIEIAARVQEWLAETSD